MARFAFEQAKEGHGDAHIREHTLDVYSGYRGRAGGLVMVPIHEDRPKDAAEGRGRRTAADRDQVFRHRLT